MKIVKSSTHVFSFWSPLLLWDCTTTDCRPGFFVYGWGCSMFLLLPVSLLLLLLLWLLLLLLLLLCRWTLLALPSVGEPGDILFAKVLKDCNIFIGVRAVSCSCCCCCCCCCCDDSPKPFSKGSPDSVVVARLIEGNIFLDLMVMAFFCPNRRLHFGWLFSLGCIQ